MFFIRRSPHGLMASLGSPIAKSAVSGLAGMQLRLSVPAQDIPPEPDRAGQCPVRAVLFPAIRQAEVRPAPARPQGVPEGQSGPVALGERWPCAKAYAGKSPYRDLSHPIDGLLVLLEL